MDIKNRDKLLIDLARQTIHSKLYDLDELKDDFFLENMPSFKDDSATFVTITIDGNLRGCIGSLIARRSLITDIKSNAYSAAFEDPRFPPLSKEEYKNIKIEISLLSEPSKLEYKDFKDLKTKLIPNKHGVILKLGFNQATFLPQVWEQLPEFETFMYHLYNKANLDINKQTVLPEIYTYSVDKIEE
ncbi:MAG: AmmeMemoRadiSam system protein A [Campylobacterota bacterium]|nr:AmmeMemoRadiSam system protein A [Campylobacterota bacterium]